jgi:RNA polymerase sigma factor (sigma-70 family)
MKSDSDLLRSYVRENCCEAFTEIVRRNVDLVHSCVLRRVGGDSQLAEDVTQRVFSDLARKAPGLTHLSSVSGWLYVGANMASAEAVRRERRRKAREIEGAKMLDVLPPGNAYSEDEWSGIRDLVDDLVCEMNPSDREAVVLRFFAKQTFLDIAEVQGTTEESARKRVSRALDRIRVTLEKAGITSSTEALEAVLTKQPGSETSEKFADRVASIAMVQFGATGAATSWLLSLFRVLTSKTAASCVVFVAAAILIAWQSHQNAFLEAEIDRLQGQSGEIGSLEHDNRRLTQTIVESLASRRALAKDASRGTEGRAAGAERPGRPRLNVSVTADGRIIWENDPVDLNEFLNRLVAHHSQDPDSEAPLVVDGSSGAAFSATAYVVEQASKAGIHNITVNSPSTPTQSDGWVTVEPSSPSALDRIPPELPDVSPKP